MGVARKLAEHHTVWSPDLRNHGHSPHAPAHTYQAMKDDLADFFDDHIPEKASLLGHSMGGKLAMWFAADYPELVNNLIVADIAPKDYLLLEDESQYHLHRNIMLALMELHAAPVTGRRELEERLSEKIDRKEVIQFLVKNSHYNRETRMMVWKINVEALFDHLEEIVSGVNARWFDGRIPVTAYPVTFIRGLDSRYIQDQDIPEIRNIYPEADIIDIPGAGHWLHAEQPALFLAAVHRAMR
jgi:pimeloyl-ACP methyl ester carboxylesterase